MSNVPETRRDMFFSKKNEGLLERLLTTDFKRRIGTELSPTQENALDKRIVYYMSTIFNDAENATASIQELNKEVLQAVVPDYLSYLKRPTRPSEDSDMDRIRNDVSSRFDMMQQERQDGRGALPSAPNFQLSLDDDYPPTLNRLEQLKKEREAEANRNDILVPRAQPPPPVAPKAIMPDDMRQRIESDDMFRVNSNNYKANDENALALRDASRRARNSEVNTLVDVLPDPRRSFFGESDPAVFGTRMQGIANANPTLVLPEAIQTRPPLPQDIIKPQSDVVSYRDNEYNLFIYSADRDWVNNTTENRYNFSVNFDPANNKRTNASGYGLSPSTYVKFKNIARIELVKVIMPTEGIEVLTEKSSSTAYLTNSNINVFAYPYLQIRIDELNTNGFGTNDGLNNAFGVVSYDAYWASDSSLNNRGFTRLIPKFLKCQKIYYPTPLATLQKLTIQIQKPDGTLLSSGSDAMDVSGIVTSAQLFTGTNTKLAWENCSTVDATGTNYRDVSGEYLWIQTKSWFSQFAVTQGDRIVFQNVAYPSSFTPTGMAMNDFLNYINRPEGHLVVDIAQSNLVSTTLKFATGSNKLGYSNFIIIRNNFNDPTTGATSLYVLGGSSTLNNAFLTAIATTPTVAPATGQTPGRLLNMSHQIQLIFRVITRDMDSSTRLRPDNL
jgi:hypothetical protein